MKARDPLARIRPSTREARSSGAGPELAQRAAKTMAQTTVKTLLNIKRSEVMICVPLSFRLDFLLHLFHARAASSKLVESEAQ